MKYPFERYLWPALAILLAALGFWSGSRWQASQVLAVPSGSIPAKLGNVDFSPLWQTWDLIDEHFVAANRATSSTSTVLTSQDKVWGLAEGLTHSLGDPYSEFLKPEVKKQFDQDIQGEFGGVGIELGVREGALVVISALPNTPAKAAGLKSGDKVIEVEGQATGELSIGEAIGLIRGAVGTTVRLKIDRASLKAPFEVKLTRAIINVPTLETEQLANHAFLIRLFNFGATAPDLFRQALRTFVQSGDDKLIIDLRGNPGGFLEAAVDMASWFLPLGKPVALEDRGPSVPVKIYRSHGYDIFSAKLKLAILVDGGSASAAEILAGALHEYGLAKLVGEQTFGKGSVQELLPVGADASLKLTVARWLTPGGVSISHQGLTPDVVVKMKDEKDPVAVDKALELLK